MTATSNPLRLPGVTLWILAAFGGAGCGEPAAGTTRDLAAPAEDDETRPTADGGDVDDDGAPSDASGAEISDMWGGDAPTGDGLDSQGWDAPIDVPPDLHDGGPEVEVMTPDGTHTEEPWRTLPLCGVDPVFDRLPLATADFIAFRPLGFVSIPIHVFPAKHSAFARSAPGDTRPPAPVVFPGHAWVTGVNEATFLASGEVGYSVTFRPCRDLRASFGHIGTVDSALRTAMSAVTPTCQEVDTGPASGIVRKCEYGLMHEVASGDPVGMSDHYAGVDMPLLDYRVAAAFVRPEHYNYEWLLYVSPLDQFTPAARAALTPMIRSLDGTTQRTAEPLGGSYVQDVAGTAQGNWFLPDRNLANSGDVGSFVALVHDNVDPTQPIFAIGIAVPSIAAGLYSFTPAASGRANRDFADVTADGQVTCYDAFVSGRTAGALPVGEPPGAILVAMPDAETLLIEGVAEDTCAGDHAAWTMSAAATRFVR
jgi:hypothetical protein